MLVNSQSSELLVFWNLFLQQGKKRNHFVYRHRTNDKDSFKKCGDRWVAMQDNAKLYHLHCNTWHMKDIFIASRWIVGCSLFTFFFSLYNQFLVRDMSNPAKKKKMWTTRQNFSHVAQIYLYCSCLPNWEKLILSLKHFHFLSLLSFSFYFYAKQPDVSQPWASQKCSCADTLEMELLRKKGLVHMN